MRNAERFTGIAYVFFGLSFAVAFLALVDWCADGHALEYALGIWNGFPPLMQLVIVCLVAGVACVFIGALWIIQSAEPVDEDECPINVKGRK